MRKFASWIGPRPPDICSHLLKEISPPYHFFVQKGGRPPRPPPHVGKLYFLILNYLSAFFQILRMFFRVELSTKHNTFYTHNTHMLILGHFQIHNTCYTHIFFYVYTSVHNFLKLNYLSAFFQILRMFFMLSWSFTDS